MTKQRVLEIFYFNAGGGHSSAMNALKDVIAEHYPEWIVKPVDLQDLLKSLDPVHQTTRMLSESLKKFRPDTPFKVTQAQDFYNNMLKKGSTRGMKMGLRMTQLFIKSITSQMEDLLRQHWQSEKNEKPDLVVSVIPNFNRPLFNALKDVHPSVPYTTILTDMVDFPPHFWMENQDQIVVCGTGRAYNQAVASGYYQPQNIHKVSGMILRKSFYNLPEQLRLTHEDIGLNHAQPTAMIMFGGNGSSVSQDIVDQLRETTPDMQTIVMCGKNVELYKSLQGTPNCHAVGFVTNVADYIRLSDIFIGKPGPGSISEAIHLGVPVIVECNSLTMPQERPNVKWVQDNGSGIAIKSFKTGIVEAVQHMTDHLDLYKDNIRRSVPPNRAVYEIVDLFDQIMSADPVPCVAKVLSSEAPSRGRILTKSIKRRLKQRIPG